MSKTTHLICILDRSGSMGGLTDEVIGSFNDYVDDQRKIKGKAKLTLILFDNKYEVVHDKVKLNEVPELTETVYFSRGMTALNDAIGKTISDMQDKKKAIVMIQTDGYENASHEWTQDAVKTLIKDQTKKGWEFIFMGANIDAQKEGAGYGLSFGDTVQFDPTAKGVKDAYGSMKSRSAAYRANV